MAIGFIAKKVRAVNASFLRELSAFLVNIALPFTFLSSIDRSIPKSALPEMGIMALWSFSIFGVAIAFSALAYRSFPERLRKVLSFATVFSNCAFMGIPIVQSVSGARGLMFTTIYNVAFTVFFYTYGISLFQDKAEAGQWKQAVFNPGIVATVVGIVLWLLPFALPAFITDSINLMAKMQTPMAMFIVGANIANIKLGKITSWKALFTAVVARLAFMPLLVYAVVVVLGGDMHGAPGIAFILTAMPAAAQTVVLSEKMGGDSTFASEIVFTTTLLSIITTPLYAGLLA